MWVGSSTLVCDGAGDAWAVRLRVVSPRGSGARRRLGNGGAVRECRPGAHERDPGVEFARHTAACGLHVMLYAGEIPMAWRSMRHQTLRMKVSRT